MAETRKTEPLAEAKMEEGTKLYPVHIACNDPDNGLFAGKAQAIQLDFGDRYFELELSCGNEPSFRLLGDGRFRLGRRVYSFERSKDWIGNWCWNGYWLRPLEAAKLVMFLIRDGRFTPGTGDADAWEAWHEGRTLRFMQCWREARYPRPKLIELVGSESHG